MINYAVFILTHGRPNAQHTLKKLLSCGYTGKYYLVLDDQDDTVQQYIDNYGAENILIFDKNHFLNHTDGGTNDPPPKCAIYARNAIEHIAEDMGLDAFVLADDDIISMRFRPIENERVTSYEIQSNMDTVIEEHIKYLLEADLAATSFCIAHYMFGGIKLYTIKGNLQKLRIPYNFMFRNTKKKVNWVSAFGEDVVTAIVNNNYGNVMLTLPFVQVSIVPLGTAEGGMFETYRLLDHFKRAMYDFIYLPAATAVYRYKDRFVASIRAGHAFPQIVANKYRKLRLK